jgi:hypothetical protein
MLKLWSLYLDSLSTSPLLTKCLTSAVGFILGDSIAQAISSGEPYSFLRTVRYAVIGLTLHAPIADTWFRFLERVSNILPASQPPVAHIPCRCQVHYASAACAAVFARLLTTHLPCRLSIPRLPPGNVQR